MEAKILLFSEVENLTDETIDFTGFSKMIKQRRNIIFVFLLLSINLSAQVRYDTIPRDDEAEIGGWSEKLPVFKDFLGQMSTYFSKVDWEDLDCYGKKVYVSTTFGKDGKLKDTRVLRAVNPACDSMAFYFVKGLKEWLPGLHRGRFVDISFVFPIRFDSTFNDRKSGSSFFLDETEEEYAKRKAYFDFVYSNEYGQEIIGDFELFRNYLAEVLSDSQHVYIFTDYEFPRKEGIELRFKPPENKDLHLLVRAPKQNRVLYDYRIRRGKVRIPREKKLFLLFYQEGTPPLLQTGIMYAKDDTTINLTLEHYTKGQLLDEIKEIQQ
ncbi:hypothetical protein [Prolixibacter denitrificans]|uniref:TonB-like protein n=2 Tax=Prolixibacter denitrificans TaxID=1541063 RepID=A0ABQ0ZL67_9BACT|nr:hypothetical protein [Prolixibacter denitrificans]GET22237.1 hypothetical protein JCM18694_24830 [Prolixibacter denitrificans]